MSFLTRISFLLCVLSFFCFQEVASSAEATQEVRISFEEKTSELIIDIEDTYAVANACDYFVRRLEYIKPVNTLVVELGKEPCSVDRWGKRRGQLKWLLPPSLRGSSSRMCLIVDQRKVGLISIENGLAQFRVSASNVCE